MPKKQAKEVPKTRREKVKAQASRFRNEFKKAMLTAITAAFGFLIALVWRDVITEYVNIVAENSPVQGKLVSALIVTIICVIGIVLLSYLTAEKQ